MVDPYRMVFVNIILSLILLGGILFYSFIYPKKKINLFILLIVIGLLPLFSMLRSGTYQSGDLSLHAIRTMSFYKILFTEHIIPVWTPEFYAGFGDPYFSFAYFLPYFIGSLFHLIGFSFLVSLKLLMAFSYILSGVFMYLFVRDQIGEKAGFTAGIFYMFAPFHLVNMHFQVTIAMTLSYLFLPLNLYLTKKIILNYKPKWFIFLSFSEMLFVLSHQVTSLAFLPINIIYGLFLIKDNNDKLKPLLKFFLSIIFGLTLSAFYWLPILLESKFTQQIIVENKSLLFPTINQLLYSTWRYGFLFQGPKGELSYLIGYTQIFVIFLSLYLFFTKKYSKKLKKIFLFSISLIAILIFFILPISKPLWFTIPFIKSFQFTTRLLIPLSLFIAILAGVVVSTVNKKWFFILLCTVTVLYTILNWGNRTTIKTINDDVLAKENKTWLKLNIAGFEPSSPVWVNFNKHLGAEKRKNDIEVLSGTAIVKKLSRSSTIHEYTINVISENSRIKENTLYFPGWELKVNNKKSNINYQSTDNMGIITFNLPKGNYDIQIEFTKTPIRKFSDSVSILSILILITFILSLSFKQSNLIPKFRMYY